MSTKTGSDGKETVNRTSTRINDQGRRVIDLENYAPHFLTSVNSALTSTRSARYLADFGVGFTEWRVMACLAKDPDIRGAQISEIIALDKAAVSRAVSRLEKMELVRVTRIPRDPRCKGICLTPKGYTLHDRILKTALQQEAALIEGIDDEDLDTFLRVIRIMLKNVENL